MKNLNKFLPHFLSIFGFIAIALFFFYPVLSGKQLMQSDIVQYTGMAKEQIEFRKEYNEEPYWTNSAFGGMPTYQLGAKYLHNYIKSIDGLLRFLPRPADYLFLYLLSFYLLLLSLKIKPLQAFFGALAFGFSTYLIIIIGAGHNAKAHAIDYIPMLLAGIIFVFSKRYLIGGILTMLAAALELQANHFQMTYYFLFLILFVVAFYVYEIIKNKDFTHLYKSIGILCFGAVLAVGTNATGLMATAEYAKYSTRSNSELTYEPDGKAKTSKNAMSYDYITQYSYGIAESLNLIAPKIFGSDSDKFDKNSKTVSLLVENGEDPSNVVDKIGSYWGDQPGVSAPAYIGVVVFFLALLALFLEKRKIKYALLIGIIFSLLLSYGKNFESLTNFFIDFVPMYNKFRAVSSIQVILELCFPVLAALGLNALVNSENENRKKAILYAGGITASILVLLYIFSGVFTFIRPGEESYGKMILDAFIQDRKDLYDNTILRSLFFLAIAFIVAFMFLKEKITSKNTIIIIGLFAFLDLFVLAKGYIKPEDFVSKSNLERPFGEPSEADENILKDTTKFRVLNIDENMNGASTSFYHQSIGGYSAVKPKKMQELFDYQIANNNMEVLNMLNTKYILQSTTDTIEGQPMQRVQAIQNPNANGNGWFISKVNFVKNADEEMKALSKIKSKNEVIINSKINDIKENTFSKDSLAKIQLTSYKPNHLKYTSNNPKNGFGVFAEIYYEKGWKATIDGKEAKILNVNYVLRGLQIPAGNHKIEFKFEPEVVKTGSRIALISFILMILSIGIGVFYWRKENKKLAELK
jgi:hypothetical protein